MRELGEKMADMPEKGFLREFANASALNVVNSLGSITSKYAKKSGIYDGATKARAKKLVRPTQIFSERSESFCSSCPRY